MRELLSRYTGASRLQIAAATRLVFAMNALTGIVKLILGVYLRSSWFAVNAIYCMLLCAARGQALAQLEMTDSVGIPPERCKNASGIFVKSGLIISLIGATYFIVCLHMYLSGNTTVYGSDYAVYGVATAAFAKFGFAVAGAVSKK